MNLAVENEITALKEHATYADSYRFFDHGFTLRSDSEPEPVTSKNRINKSYYIQ